MRILRAAPAVCLTIIPALLLTLAGPMAAFAREFRCASGDVECLISSMRSASERPGSHRIILEAGTYVPTAADNFEDIEDTFQGGNALPSVTTRLAIEGAGAAETILSPVHALRALHIGSSGTLTLRGVTIRDGSTADAGTIFNRGTLSVSDTVIQDSFADAGGGIFNLGTLLIVDSRLTRNTASVGGGVMSSGVLVIVRSTIDLNAALMTGGISASGATTIDSSTIAGNFSEEHGGIELVGGTATITNSTIVNNRSRSIAGGGLTVSSGTTVHVLNATIADNTGGPFLVTGGQGGGGGIFVDDGTVGLQNTVLARNIVFGTLGAGPDCLGPVVSLGNNVIGDVAGCTVDPLSTDHIGSAGLSVFVDDETPGRGHIPLLAGSPAIDAGNPAVCPKRDQLNHRRVDGDDDGRTTCDVGSVEFLP